jgi:hypothetical protein
VLTVEIASQGSHCVRRALNIHPRKNNLATVAEKKWPCGGMEGLVGGVWRETG